MTAYLASYTVPTPHSQVIMARSPYLEAKVNRWCKDKRELVIEDCDLVTFNIIVDYMYGGPIPESVVNEDIPHIDLTEKDLQNTEILLQYSTGTLGSLAKLLQMSDRLLMVDLKGEVEELMIKIINDDSRSWILTLGIVPILMVLGEKYDCQKLLLNCARHWCARCGPMKNISMDESCTIVKRSPKFAAALLVAVGELN